MTENCIGNLLEQGMSSERRAIANSDPGTTELVLRTRVEGCGDEKRVYSMGSAEGVRTESRHVRYLGEPVANEASGWNGGLEGRAMATVESVWGH